MCRSLADGRGRRCPGHREPARRASRNERRRGAYARADKASLNAARRARYAASRAAARAWEEEQAGWDAIGVRSSGVADAWVTSGFSTPADAQPYLAAGVCEPRDAAAWRDGGWPVARVRGWVQAGVSPALAAELREQGVHSAAGMRAATDAALAEAWGAVA